MAMNRAIESIRGCQGNLPHVPLHLRNANTKLDRDLGYGIGYSFNPEERKKMDIMYMPDGMETVNYFK